MKETDVEVEDCGLYGDKDDSDLFKDVFFIVDATSEEHHNLWCNWHFRPVYPREPVDWVQIPRGKIVTIGEFHKRTISVLVEFAIVKGKKVMFYTGFGELIDNKIINRWIDKYSKIVQKNAKNEIVQTNSANFHHCIDSLKRMK